LLELLCLAASKIRQAAERADAHETCRLLADLALAALVRIDSVPIHEDYRSRAISRGSVITMLTRGLLVAGLDDLLSRLLCHVSQSPSQYPLHAVQLPSLAELKRSMNGKLLLASGPLARWVASCIAELESLTAVEPKPPTDFRREARINCKCKNCAELNRFLDDPATPEHRFQAAQEQRKHIETNINICKCDLTCKTDKRPRPQILICTKTTMSFQRRLSEYVDNLKHLEALRSLKADTT
jgi:hypothetical protein